MNMTRQNLYGREFKILEGDGLTGMCEGAIDAGGGVLATNTAMMCRPFCASGAGNPIISAHRTPFPGFQWDEVWFGYQGFTSEEEFLRSHGFFGSGRCYVVVVDGGEKKLVALEDFVQLCPDAILGPRLKPLGHGMRRYSKFFINRSRLPHHTHDCKEEAYWIEPAMIVDFDLFDEQCFMAVGLHEDFGPNELRAHLTRQGWDDPSKVLKQHARWVYMHPGAAMIMKTQILHGPAAFLPHYEPQFYDDGYRMYEPMPKIPRSLLVGREIPEHLRGDPDADADGDREALLDYLVSGDALDWASIHDPRYSERHTCTPLLDSDTCDGRDVTDHWIVYGAFGRAEQSPGVRVQTAGDSTGCQVSTARSGRKRSDRCPGHGENRSASCVRASRSETGRSRKLVLHRAGWNGEQRVHREYRRHGARGAANLRSGSSDDASAALAGSLDARSETLTGASSTISVRTWRGLKPAPYFSLVAWLPRGDGASGLWILLSVFCLTYS